MNVQEYLNELAKTAGLDDEAKAGLTKALGNTKFVEELDKGIKRQSDYSRAMDEVKTSKQAVDTQIQTWREWYTGAVESDTVREAELQEWRAGKRSPTNPNPNPTPTPTPGLTEKQLQEREERMISIVKQGMRLASRHAARFGEELDTDALEKIAVDNGISLENAYEKYVAPRVKEADEKSFAEKLRIAREEGLKEGLSKRDLPDESTRGFHPIHDHNKAVEVSGKLTDAQRRANFESEWNKQPAAK